MAALFRFFSRSPNADGLRREIDRMSNSASGDQPIPNRMDDKLRGFMHVNGLHDIGTVYTHRVLAETELGSNLSVGSAINDQLQYL